MSEECRGWRPPARRVEVAGKAGEATGQREGREGRGVPGWGDWERRLTSSQFCPVPLPKRNKTGREVKLIFLTENWRF